MKHTAHINIDKIVERINMLLDQSFDLQITTRTTFPNTFRTLKELLSKQKQGGFFLSFFHEFNISDLQECWQQFPFVLKEIIIN